MAEGGLTPVPASDQQIRDVCTLLHSRGREATPEQVAEWLDKMRREWLRSKGMEVDTREICHAVLDGQKTMTMCLHLHFGDAL